MDNLVEEFTNEVFEIVCQELEDGSVWCNDIDHVKNRIRNVLLGFLIEFRREQ